MMIHLLFSRISSVAGILVCCSAVIAQNGAPVARIVSRIDEHQLITLKGNTHPSANAMSDRGRVGHELPMTDLVLVLSRNPEQQAAFDKFVASQYDPKSLSFHHWLEPDEVGKEFGPAQADIDTVTDWLRGNGFSVDGVAKNRLSIRFSGTAAQVEGAFHTEIHNLEVKGIKHIGNVTDPKIPAALLPAVSGIKALHNFFPRPLHRQGSGVTLDRKSGRWKRIGTTAFAGAKTLAAARPRGVRPQFGSMDSYGDVIEEVTPYDFAAIYNVLPLWGASTSIDGSGQTIAIAGTSSIDSGDIDTFRSAFGLPAIESFTTILANNTDPGQCGINPITNCTIDDQVENSLDVEWSGAVAPGANIVLVVSGSNSATTDTVYSSADYVVENKTASILNVSYGECELGEGTSGNVAYYNLWQTAASEGIAVFVAAGDSGSSSCDQGMDQDYGTPWAAGFGVSVSGMASTPYNTAVGGTDFNWCPATAINSNVSCTASPYWGNSNSSTTRANAIGYVPEIPWNNSCASPTGIAIAQYWANQLYEIGYSVTSPIDGETACNFFFEEYQTIIEVTNGIDVSGFVDTVGGGGGASGCVVNNGALVSSCFGTSTGAGNGSIALVNDGWPKPSWQTGVTGIPSDGVRDLPDVSFLAASGLNNTAYLICISANDNPCTYTGNTNESPLYMQEVGGTSVASATMAGVMALINQKAGGAEGNPNSELYKLAAAQNYSKCSAESVKVSSACYFNDVDLYTSAQPCDYGDIGYLSPNCTATESYNGSADAIGILSSGIAGEGGYNAHLGYDLATGLGSLNVANVVNAWPAAAAPPVVSLTPGNLNFSNTSVGSPSATQTITVKNDGNAALTLAGNGNGIAIIGTYASSYAQTNTCGASVSAGAGCVIAVTFKPASSGTLNATVNIADNASGSPQTVTLTGTGTAPVMILSPASLTFSGATVGTTVATQAIKLNNTGNAALNLSGTGLGISISGSNASSYAQTNTCGASVSGGTSCVITVTFKPASSGTLNATVNIADNIHGSPQTVTLTGTGVTPVVLSETSVNFGNVVVNTTSSTKTVILTNNQSSALTISSLALTGSGYALSPLTTCPGSGALAANTSCTLALTFSPATGGVQPGSLVVSFNASNSPLTASLIGTGTYLIVLSTTLVNFGDVPVNTTSAIRTVVLANAQTSTLTISSLAVLGRGFALDPSTTCPRSGALAAGTNCTLELTFTPGALGGVQQGSLVVGINTGNSPQTVMLTGAGTAPVVSLSPASLTFSGTPIGATATTQAIILNNTGNGALNLNGSGLGISITGTNASSYSETNTCAASVAAGINCEITVTFKPTVSGTLNARVNIVDNAAGSPQAVALTGEGTSVGPEGFAISNSGNLTLNPGAVTGNTSTITTTPLGGFTGVIDLSCTVASPSGVTNPPTCSVPASVTVRDAKAQNATLTISTAAATSAVNRATKLSWPTAGSAALALVLFLGFPARRRCGLLMLGIVFFAVSVGGLTGCSGMIRGNSGNGSGTSAPGSTPGAYTVTVSGNSGSISQTTTLTVTVD